MRRTSLLAAALVLTAAALPLEAQRLGPAPKRPHAAALADTNDARAYFDFGLSVAASSPGEAASAFYWAARIDPGFGDALYGRRVAMLLADEELLRQYMSDGKPSKTMRQLDSLMLRAVVMNPFLYRRLDVQLFRTYYHNAVNRSVQMSGGNAPSPGEIDFYITRMLNEAGPNMRGWMAYANGDFNGALRLYADAMKRAKQKTGFHLERGRIFGMTGQADSALAELRVALDELRKQDAKDVVYVYNSKAVIEQSIGKVLEQQDSLGAAREAYGRALQEDLAYWPAHLQLANMAIMAKDTATAVSELALATQIAPDEPYVHAIAGASLGVLDRPSEAIAELKKAAELEPLYALPHLLLAQVHETKKDYGAALTAYDTFLARASQHDVRRELATQRRDALRAAGGGQ